MLLPLHIREEALREIQYILREKKIPADYGLRIGVKGGGGCGGATFVLGFDKKNESDQEFQVENVPVYIDKKHFMFLIGVELGFEEGAEARGFVFSKQES